MRLSTKGIPEHEFATDKFGARVCLRQDSMDDGEGERLRHLRVVCERRMNRAQYPCEAMYWLRMMLKVQARASRLGYCV